MRAGGAHNIMRLELTAAQQSFRDSVRAFAKTEVEPVAARIDATNEFPHALVAEAGRRGLMEMTIPPDAGGAGLDYVSYTLAIEAITHASATLAVILTVNNSLVVEVIA